MSAPVTPAPDSAQAGSLSEPQRVANMYYAPSKTFEDIRHNAKWWGPLLVLIVISYVATFVIQKQIGWQQLTESIYANMSDKQKENIEKAPPEQQAAIHGRIEGSVKFFSYAGPVLIVVVALIMALVLMATFTFGMGKKVGYWQSTAIVFYSFMPGVIKSILFIITLYVGVDMASFNIENPVATNAAFWMNKADMPALYAIAQKFDIFNIWQAVLMGIGFAVLTRSKKSTGIAVVMGWLVVVALVTAGFAAAFS